MLFFSGKKKIKKKKKKKSSTAFVAIAITITLLTDTAQKTVYYCGGKSL